MIGIIRTFVVIIALSLVAGCTTGVKMVNTSPDQNLPEITDFTTIPVTIGIRPEDPQGTVSSYIVEELTKQEIFSKVFVMAPGEETDFVQLVVSENTKSDMHLFKDIGLCLLTGGLELYFGYEEYDYEVKISAKIINNGKTIGSYTGMGSHHEETPEILPLNVKLENQKRATKLSWQHATQMLAAKIKQDRDKIVAELEK